MDWEEVRLGEIVTLRQGFALNSKSKHYIAEKGIALLKISDLFNNTETLFVNENIPKQFLVFEDEIIYTRTAQVGYAFMGKKGVIYNNCFKVIPNENKINKFFLFQLLNSKNFRIYAQTLATGTAQQDLNHGAFKSIKIKLPPLKIQKKIASILSNYDKLIENNNQRIKLLESMAEEIYKEWFVRLRFPECEKVEIVDGVPEGWEKKLIENICSVGRGSSPRPITDSKYFVNGDIPWLKIADATASFIYIYETREYVNNYGASFSRKLSKGSLIVAASGTLGFPMFLATECCIHDGWIYFIDLKKDFKIYFYYSLISLQDYFTNQSYGAAIQNINTSIVKKSSILVPSNSILNEFNQIVQPIFDEIQLLQLKNKNLKETRDLLLPKLINGTLNIEELVM